MSVYDKLKELGIELPEANAPAAMYSPGVRAGAHARSAVGCAALPGDAACEVELIVKLKNE